MEPTRTRLLMATCLTLALSLGAIRWESQAPIAPQARPAMGQDSSKPAAKKRKSAKPAVKAKKPDDDPVPHRTRDTTHTPPPPPEKKPSGV